MSRHRSLRRQLGTIGMERERRTVSFEVSQYLHGTRNGFKLVLELVSAPALCHKMNDRVLTIFCSLISFL